VRIDQGDAAAQGLGVDSKHILGTRVDATSYSHATGQILEMARQGSSGYICIANVHVVMEAHDSSEFMEAVNGADLVTPDGVPIVWMMRALGVEGQTRVYGPSLTLRVCEAAADEGVPVGFLGSKPDVLAKLKNNLKRRFPSLEMVYSFAPPFHPLSEEENDKIADEIRDSGARIVFVGLGCPKQEKWIAANASRADAVLAGVGAAFDFHAGTLRQAPDVFQRVGLEWLFRLAMEPKRLWRRYAYHNPRFVALALKQLLKSRIE
jgi:N-acetylglucosaminyldiphosphoundecaprenol N-acetyl-beta-D-mannosaminyltransferase